MTITEFLLARIEEREIGLQIPSFYEVESVRGPGWGNRGSCWICDATQFDGTEDVTEDAYAEHLERVHSRTEALADLAAKRAIIAEAEMAASAAQAGELDTTPAMDRVLTYLAAPYADHPDYKQWWR